MGGDRCADGVAQLVGVAVVGGDREEGTRAVGIGRVSGLDGGDDAGQGQRRWPRSASSVASHTPVWPTMSGLA